MEAVRDESGLWRVEPPHDPQHERVLYTQTGKHHIVPSKPVSDPFAAETARNALAEKLQREARGW